MEILALVGGVDLLLGQAWLSGLPLIASAMLLHLTIGVENASRLTQSLLSSSHPET